MAVLERGSSHGQGDKERGNEELELHLEGWMGLTRKLKLASDEDCLDAGGTALDDFFSRG